MSCQRSPESVRHGFGCPPRPVLTSLTEGRLSDAGTQETPAHSPSSPGGRGTRGGSAPRPAVISHLRLLEQRSLFFSGQLPQHLKVFRVPQSVRQSLAEQPRSAILTSLPAFRVRHCCQVLQPLSGGLVACRELRDRLLVGLMIAGGHVGRGARFQSPPQTIRLLRPPVEFEQLGVEQAPVVVAVRLAVVLPALGAAARDRPLRLHHHRLSAQPRHGHEERASDLDRLRHPDDPGHRVHLGHLSDRRQRRALRRGCRSTDSRAGHRGHEGAGQQPALTGD